MFSKSFVAFAIALLPASQVLGHAIMMPALGVEGTPRRRDVMRTSDRNPCGRGVDVAEAMPSATPVVADASGAFTVAVTNFNEYVYLLFFTNVLLI